MPRKSRSMRTESPGAFGSSLAGPASTAHIMGTARMGEDPAKSVTDPWGRLHDVENVYLGDGSVFASAGGFNPTLTENIHQALGGQGGLQATVVGPLAAIRYKARYSTGVGLQMPIRLDDAA